MDWIRTARYPFLFSGTFNKADGSRRDKLVEGVEYVSHYQKLMNDFIIDLFNRLCLQYGRETNVTSNKEYFGMMDALRKIYYAEGVRGLYKVTDIHFMHEIFCKILCCKI